MARAQRQLPRAWPEPQGGPDVQQRTRRPIAERFWEKVQVGGPEDCWEWAAFTRPDGYGMFRMDSTSSMWTAQRVAWTLTYGTIPDGLHVLHDCDNPSCANPAHLFLGTNADNVADKIAKGRWAHTVPGKQGELHPLAKLTNAQVAEVRAASTGARGEGRMFATKYDVSPALVCLILKGRIRKNG